VKIAELTKNFNGMSIKIRKKEKLLQEEQWAYLSTHPSKRLHSFCFDDEDYTSAITPDEPVLSTEEPDNSLSMRDEHLDTILATKSDEFIKSGVENLIPIPSEYEGILEHVCDVPSHDNSLPLDASPPDSELVSSEVMEIVIPEVGGIDDDILLTINHDDLREKLLNVNLLIAKIEELNANSTPSFDCKTKSSSTSLTSILEETNTFNNSLPKFKTFCFDVEEISSGSTTTHPDISLPEYEVFYDDHVKEISSGSPTTHSDSSLYAPFMFDLSINPFPPADMIYEAEVQKKPNSNSQDMAFISSSRNSNNKDGNTVCVTTATTAFPTSSVNVATISQDTASAFITSQSNGSQIKFKDINQIDEDDMEEINIKWNIALLSMRTNKFWKRTRKKISIQGSDVAGLLKASKNLGHLIESQKSNQVKEGVGYNAVPPPAADLYLSPKKDLSWTGLPEFVDDTVTDYSRPSPTVVSTSAEGQNKDPFTSEDVASPNSPKALVKHSNKGPKGNQRNWNNLKSYQLGPEFVLYKKPCFNCGDFLHLANVYRRRVQRETTRSQNHPYKSPSHRSASHRPNGAPISPPLRSSSPRPHGGSMRPSLRPTGHRPHSPLMNP
nr:hypothetical protein [Tanacetum cinerariifolium]